MAVDDSLTRHGLRHMLVRARNARATGELRDSSPPAGLLMSQATWEELVADQTYEEAWTIDGATEAFMGIPVLIDGRLALGVVTILWPKEAAVRG